MIELRKANDRGSFKNDWLTAKYSFSFSEYFDPQRLGFHFLRVLNEDKIQAGKGFAMHLHQNMEIITFIIDGQLQHTDDIGNTGIIKKGDIQRMSAGSGIMHAESNPGTDTTHLLQIWIKPKELNIKPSYEQKSILDLNAQESLLVSPNAKANSLSINQNIKIYLIF